MTRPQLNDSLNAWNTTEFESVLVREIQKLGLEYLPLQQGLASASYALDDDISVMIIRVSENNTAILIKAGIFYSGIIAGCSCADDPTPLDKTSEHCVVQLDIDKKTAETEITLVAD